MMRTILLSLAACGALIAASPDFSKQDVTFLRQALASGEAELAGVAVQSRSSDSNVHLYAESIRLDHETMDARLRAIAKDGGIAIAPATPAPAAVLAPQAYLKQAIATHQHAIALYEKEVNSGSDAALVAFAKDAVPVLQSHEQLARKLLAQLHGRTAPLSPPIPPRPTASPPSPSPSPAPSPH